MEIKGKDTDPPVTYLNAKGYKKKHIGIYLL